MSSTKELAIAILATKDANGRVTPEGVFEAAHDPNNPLHSQFEWDKDKAWHEHNLDIARSLLRRCKIEMTTLEGLKVNVPQFVRDTTAESKEQGYIETMSIKPRSPTASELLALEMARIVALIERARKFAIALDLEDDLEALLQHAVTLQEKVKEPEPA